MTSDFSLMSTSSPAKSLPSIYAADGNCMNISHTGNHYYTFNLVSVGQLCDLGLNVSFSPNGCQVQDPQTGQTIWNGSQSGKIV